MYSDHSAVKAVLKAPNPSGKYARWWTRAGISEVDIVYRPGKNCANTDALSRSPLVDANAVVAAVVTEPDSISHLLASDLGVEESTTTFAEEQRKDPDICSLLRFLENPQRAKNLQAPLFTICDNILYYIDPKLTHRKRIVMPKYLTTPSEQDGWTLFQTASLQHTYQKLVVGRHVFQLFEVCPVMP